MSGEAPLACSSKLGAHATNGTRSRGRKVCREKLPSVRLSPFSCLKSSSPPSLSFLVLGSLFLSPPLRYVVVFLLLSLFLQSLCAVISRGDNSLFPTCTLAWTKSEQGSGKGKGRREKQE